MATFSALLLVWCSIYQLVCGDSGSYFIESFRDYGEAKPDSFTKVRRQTGNVSSAIDEQLYWYGNFTVGAETKPLKLLIDTGSSDLILNPGLYKPSNYSRKYGKGEFSITYEGVNRAGFGFETINGTLTYDNVTGGGLTVPQQPIGNTTYFKYIDVPPLRFANPGNGIIGFLGRGSSSFEPAAPSWFSNLCHNGLISECVFGLAFGTSGTGLTVVGKIAKSLISGPIVTVPRIDMPYHAFTTKGDVTLDNKIIFTDQLFIMDVGTDNIQAPLGPAKKIFSMLGWPTSLQVAPPNANFDPGVKSKVLEAFFQCNKPPTLGFSFPAASTMNGTGNATIFNVSPAVWDVYNHGSNNCTSILGGTNALDEGNGTTAWLVGQSFFSGHYINFDITSQTVGYANLVDPTGGG